MYQSTYNPKINFKMKVNFLQQGGQAPDAGAQSGTPDQGQATEPTPGGDQGGMAQGGAQGAEQQIAQMAQQVIQQLGPQAAALLAQMIMQMLQGAAQQPTYQRKGGKLFKVGR